jgi:RNA polymerase sigma-70 factor (ECF subfamily)
VLGDQRLIRLAIRTLEKMLPRVSTPTTEFAELVLASQRKLYAYILTLVPDADSASDILQQTNVVLWRDSERFSEGTNFLSWAFRVAYFQVLDYREKRQRDRLRFNKELFEELAAESESSSEGSDVRLEALRKCLADLPAKQRDLVQSRYGEGQSVADMARMRGQTAGSLATFLHRIRRALLDCVQRRLAGAEARK